jgi:hypothetical protein
MALITWILPTLIGLVAAVLLLTILYNDSYIRSKFADLGELIQLQTSRPVYYGAGWVPVNMDNQLPPVPATGNITSFNSPLYVDGTVSPVYNYYPQTPLNPTAVPTNKQVSVKNANTTQEKNNQNLAFANPNTAYDSHKAYYWALSGGYPYPYPILYPPNDMNNVQGVEDRI